MDLRKGMEGQFNLTIFVNNLKEEKARLEDLSAHRGGDQSMDVKANTIGSIIGELEWYTATINVPRVKL